MWTRRQFLSRGGLGLLGTAGTCYGLFGEGELAPDDTLESIPDGSASKGMITETTEKAIERGLMYLRHARNADGSFGNQAYKGNVAVTSLAAMAFMAAGHQPNRGAHGKIVTDALRFVLTQENRAREGRPGRFPGFLHNPFATPHGPMYGHGFGTLFLAEISGMVHEKALREEVRTKLNLAVQLILNAQNAEGGWRYDPDSKDADLSVTVCQIMALRAARNAGIGVPKSKVDNCIGYVKACQDRMLGSFRYQKHVVGGGMGAGFARTAAGVSALYSAGVYKGDEITKGLDFLKHNKPNGGPQPDMHYFYGHYYAVQAMWTAGGEYWKDWYPYIREELISRQNNDGSWEDQIKCRDYSTAMACIILQIPNNYLPILQK
jgi:hypothetical protein